PPGCKGVRERIIADDPVFFKLGAPFFLETGGPHGVQKASLVQGFHTTRKEAFADDESGEVLFFHDPDTVPGLVDDGGGYGARWARADDKYVDHTFFLHLSKVWLRPMCL